MAGLVNGFRANRLIAFASLGSTGQWGLTPTELFCDTGEWSLRAV
jgi:hypothetical protein